MSEFKSKYFGLPFGFVSDDLYLIHAVLLLMSLGYFSMVCKISWMFHILFHNISNHEYPK